MIVKLIFLALAVWLGYRIYQASKKIATQKSSPPKSQDMVSCEKCGVHIPVAEAIKNGNRYYCSKQHLTGSD